MPNGRGYAILDPGAGQMTMVMEERHMYLERPADPGMLAMFQATNDAFRKTGSDTVAGVACTTYDATFNEHNGQVCLTDDGVMLRARSADADRQRELEAVKVTYGEQPARPVRGPCRVSEARNAQPSAWDEYGPARRRTRRRDERTLTRDKVAPPDCGNIQTLR